MDTAPSPERPDLTLLLPRSTYWQLVHTLQTSLPPPETDCPEFRAHRDHAAIAEIASMLPANAEEASIAARCVAAHAQAMDCLRLARQHPNDAGVFLKCNAQSTSMLRAAGSARTLLARVQEARRKREANPAATDQAAWTEHCAIGLMTQAIEPPAPASEPPPPPPEPEPAADAEAAAPALTEAEQYTVIYPRRAALIRSLGGLPDNCSFGPPPPEIVQAIVTGSSPILLELDRQADTA